MKVKRYHIDGPNDFKGNSQKVIKGDRTVSKAKYGFWYDAEEVQKAIEEAVASAECLSDLQEVLIDTFIEPSVPTNS